MSQNFFAVGLLKIQDTADIGIKLTEQHYNYFSLQKQERKKVIQDLQKTSRCLDDKQLHLLLSSTKHAEYKFTNIHYKNLDRYKSLLDTAFKYPLHFCALVIDKTDPLFDKTIYKNYWYAYIKYARLLCEENCGDGERLCVIADYMTKPNSSDKFFEHEINEAPGVFNTIRAHSETFTLLQVCDLVLGSVVFQWKLAKGLATGSSREQAKALFVDHLVSNLGLSSSTGSYPLAKAVALLKPWYFKVMPLDLKEKIKNGDVQKAGLPVS